MLAAASIKVMDALFGLPARNDAECYKRELLGRSWRRDWAMCNFQVTCTKSDPQKEIKQKILWEAVSPKGDHPSHTKTTVYTQSAERVLLQMHEESNWAYEIRKARFI